MQTTNQVTLFYREGSSDKVYQASIEPKERGFVVNFAYGRRGSTLNTGTKTAVAVDYDQADKIFAKLIAEKKAKGYTEGASGTPFIHTDKAQQVSGILPQLLNPIEVEEAMKLIDDPAWCMQEKKDGKRILLQKQGAAIHGINRKGLIVGIPSPIVHCAGKIPGDFVIDGECVGDVLHAFDLLKLGEDAFESRPYNSRLASLSNFLELAHPTHIELIETAFNIEQKTSLMQRLRRDKGEGLAFKRLDAPYTPGRPGRGGAQLKHKFYATASFVVAATNAKRSVALNLFHESKAVPAGNVTIPPNQAIPEVGAVVEVRFLYAFKESRSVYQPTYLGAREDVDPAHCKVDQLKYRADNADADDP